MIIILSEEAATLVEKGQLDGTHCFQFSPTNMPSGISARDATSPDHEVSRSAAKPQVGIRLGYASGVRLYRQPTVPCRS